MSEFKTIRAVDVKDAVPPDCVRVAGFQMDISLGDVESNRQACIGAMEVAAEAGVKLLVFPECALTGYAFPDAGEARQHALSGDAALAPVVEACRRLKLSVVIGFLEVRGQDLLNTVVPVFPQGVGPRYHKTHLPHLGADRWVCAGDAALTPYMIEGVRTGLLICYDGSFPEASRTLTLQGAELIALPTNWPAQAIHKAEWLPNTRAYENVVYFMAVNRVGNESGFAFHGLSRICSPKGHTLVQGPLHEQALLIADVNPAEARQKKIIREDDYWVDRIGDRRLDLYDLEDGTA